MKPEAAATEFEKFLAQRALDRTRLTAEQGVPAMLAFYSDERADGCRFDRDADMLLYEWGTYDWGSGEFFELSITRQLIHDSSGEDEDIWQLGLTFKFSPTHPLRTLGRGHRWCHDLGELEEFEGFLRASAPFQVVAAVVPTTVKLRYECAG
jgi:hypothetical protein